MTVRELVTILGFKLDDAPVKKYDKQLDATKEKTDKLAAVTKGIGTAWKIAAAAAAIGMGWISKNILKSTGEMEQYRNQLQKFTGNADDAGKLLKELRGTMSDGLFDTGNVVNAYKSLRNLGMEAESASGFIDVLGNIADGSTENFNALSNVLTKVSVTGRVNDGVIRQLTLAGFSMQDMAESLGKSTQQLEKDIADGKIGFNELTLAMSRATQEGGRFYGNMERQARTLNGSLKILKSNISDIGDAIGTRVLPKIVDAIRYFTELVIIGKDKLVDFGAKAFDALINKIFDVIIFFQILQIRMKRFGGAFTPLKAIFEDVFGFLKYVTQSAYPFLLNLAQLILIAFKPLQAFVRPVLEALKPIIRSVFGFLSRMIQSVIPIVNGLTPLFSGLGKVVGALIGPVLAVAAGIRAVNTAIAIGKGAVAAVKAVQTAYMLLTGTMSVMKAAAEGNRLAMLMLDAQMIKSKFVAIAHTVATKAQAIATNIAAVATGIFNAVMALNPIALIIIGVMALIAAIVLLVKNWDKVSAALKKAFEAIGNFFVKIWEGIKSFFSKVVDFVKKNALNIMNVILGILFFPAGVIMAVVRLIIKHWDKIKEALLKVWEGIKAAFQKGKEFIGNVFNKVKEGAGKAWEGIKSLGFAAWGQLENRFPGLANVISNVFNRVKEIISGIIENIKGIFTGFKDFFVGLWESLKEGPVAVLEYIKNAFFGLFDSIKEKFFGFINVIKNGWETVKGFFGNVASGVVNAVTGGGRNNQQPATTTTAARPVNDLIVTPDGSYSTHPDDYIMAMKNPGDLIDALIRFLGGGQQMQPAFAGASGSLAEHSLNRAVGNSVYNNSSSSNVTNNTVPVNVTVNASGMSPEAATAAVKRGVQDAINDAIHSSRGSLPSPEARRA